MAKTAVKVENVSILFNLSKEKVDNIKEYFIKLVTRKLHFTEFWALNDISFTVEKGDRVGVLGFNGAGKSTLLKVIAGVLKPTKGSVKVNGVIAPMLELGAGFDMNYSGKENIFLYGATMGYSRKFIEEKYEAQERVLDSFMFSSLDTRTLHETIKAMLVNTTNDCIKYECDMDPEMSEISFLNILLLPFAL